MHPPPPQLKKLVSRYPIRQFMMRIESFECLSASRPACVPIPGWEGDDCGRVPWLCQYEIKNELFWGHGRNRGGKYMRDMLTMRWTTVVKIWLPPSTDLGRYGVGRTHIRMEVPVEPRAAISSAEAYRVHQLRIHQ